MFNYQRTIKNQVGCFGVGLHTGKRVDLTIKPAKEDSGIIFKRTDITDKDNIILASYANVTATMLGTTISNKDNVSVATIEHLMAALWGGGVDNCIVEINGPEVPIMDGSSEPFIFILECAGIHEQKKTRKLIRVLKTITAYENEREDSPYISISPSEGFSVDLGIDFGDQVIKNQTYNFDMGNISFKSDIARARTFCFASEVEAMHKAGLAKGGSLDNAIVVSADKVLNQEGLRYNNEFVRHKVLDCVGDIFLAGCYIQGNLKGYKSGHALNNKLLRAMFADKDAWQEIDTAVLA